jgi:Ca2+-binding EF-hand superfamily protein
MSNSPSVLLSTTSLVSAMSSTMLPPLPSKDKTKMFSKTTGASPYLQPIGRKWVTKKQRLESIRKAKLKSKQSTPDDYMASLSNTIIAPDSIPSSKSYLKPLSNTLYNEDDDGSLASSSASTIGASITSNSVDNRQSYLEQLCQYKTIDNLDDDSSAVSEVSFGFDDIQNQLDSNETNLKNINNINNSKSINRDDEVSLENSVETELSFEVDDAIASHFTFNPTPILPPKHKSNNSNNDNAGVLEDPTINSPVNLSVMLHTKTNKICCGKMILLKKTTLRKIRHLLNTHYSNFVPKKYLFLGTYTNKNDTILKSNESSILLNDICVFKSTNELGLGNVSIRIINTTKTSLPFSSSTSIEDLIKVTQEEEMVNKRAEEADLSGAAVVLGKLEGFIRKYQMRLSDVFYNAKSAGGSGGTHGTKSLTGSELKAALENIKCVIDSNKINDLVNFLDDSGDGRISQTELEDALKIFRKTQKNNLVKGIYVAESIQMTRNAVKRLWQSNDNGIHEDNSRRFNNLINYENSIGKSSKNFKQVFEESMKIQDGVYEDYVEQVSLAGSDEYSVSYTNDTNDNNDNSYKSKKGKRRYREKVVRLAVTDDDIEGVVRDVRFDDSNRITFEDFIKQLNRNCESRKHTTSSTMLKIQTILIKLTNQWNKETSKEKTLQLHYKPSITDDDVNKVVAFMDPNNDGIDSRELEDAFRLVKRAAAAENMEPGAVKCMKILIDRIRRKNVKLDVLFAELDRSGDGIVSHSEIADWLSSFGVDLDSINSTLRYLDPDNDGDMETDELKSAMRRAEVTVGRIEIEDKIREEVHEKVKHADAAVRKALDMQPDSFTNEEVERLATFLDPSNDGEIDLTELESAFRKARRTRAEKGMVVEGKRLLTRLRNMLKSKGLTVEKWFREMDGSGAAKSDGNCTTRELRLGLKKLAGNDSKHQWSESDILKLVRFMDPSGEGDLSIEEANTAFDKLNTTSEEELIMDQVGDTMIRLENFMKDKGMRLFDFFASMDKSGDGSVSTEELIAGLESLSEPSGAVRALIKRRDDALEQQEAERLAREEEQKALNAKINEAKSSGAAGVLIELEMVMKDKGLRLTDLFREIDKDGSGTITAEELRFGMKLMSEPKAEALAPLKKAREKLLKKRKELVEKMMQAQKFADKIAVAENCGAAKVVVKLENFMRKKQLRVKDLFQMIDKSGDGTANAAELHAALQRVRLKMSIEDVTTLIKFMDTSGDMEIDRNELELVIKDFRRFSYEQKNAHMLTAKKLPLTTMYGGLEQIFVSTDVIGGRFSPLDLEYGLRRLRGDISMPAKEEDDNAPKPLTEEESALAYSVLERLSEYLLSAENPETDDKSIGAHLQEWLTGEAYNEISVDDLRKWLLSVKTKPVKSERKKLTKPQVATPTLPKLTDELLENICNFVDPAGDGIDLKELEKAFSLVMQASSHSKMDPVALNAMRKMKSFMKEKRLRMSSLLTSLDGSGDGSVDHDEIRRWLKDAVELEDNDCTALIKYLDPDEDGDMELDELEAAMRKADITIGRLDIQEKEDERLRLKTEKADAAMKAAAATPKLEFSEDEINSIANYLDSGGDGSVEISEFESAFRKARRAIAVEAFYVEAKQLTRKLIKILKDLDLSVDTWFDDMDTSFGEGVGGSVTAVELKNGLATMKFPPNTKRFTQADVVKLVRYLDPSGEGDMTIDEVKMAFDNVDAPSAADVLKGEVGSALGRLEKFMKDKGMRLVDLIAVLSGVENGDGTDGSMTTADLKKGLAKICAPSPALQALVKARDDAAAEKADIDAKRKKDEDELEAKLKVLEETGTAKVMRGIFDIMRSKGLKLGVVFNSIDKTGDGSIERSELKVGLEMLTKSSDVSSFALEKELERKKKEEAALAAEERKKQDFFGKMSKAKQDGIADILDKINGVMRNRQLRIKDLYALKKAGGKSKFTSSKGARSAEEDEKTKEKPWARELREKKEKEKEKEEEEEEANGGQTLTATDLLDMLSRVDRKMPITLEECEKVFSYIDASGDGNVSLDELERSIGEYRRYLWEKEQEVKLKKLRLLKAAPPMFTRREAMICVKSLDMVGGMDGKISMEDLDLAISRIRGDVMGVEDMFKKGMSYDEGGTAGSLEGSVVGPGGSQMVPVDKHMDKYSNHT